MNPDWSPEFQNNFHDALIEQYTKAMNEPGVSPENKEAFQEIINIHKRRKTTK